MNNKIIVGALVILAVVAGYAALRPPVEITKETIKEIQQLGAQSETLTDGNCYLFNGQHRCPVRTTLTQATSTVCSFRSPNATSTLQTQGTFVQLDQGTSTALQITWVKSTSQYGTTTGASLLSYNTLASALKVRNMATTSLSGGIAGILATTGNDPTLTVAPNTFVNVGFAGGVPGVGNGTANQFNLTGVCAAEFVY